MPHQHSARLIVCMLAIVLLIACSASPAAEPVVASPEELVATWTAPLQPEKSTKESDPPANWTPNEAVTAEFHRRAAELGPPDANDCGLGRRWIFYFRTDRAAADACVAAALASGAPFRVHYASFDIDTSERAFLFTGNDRRLYLLEESVSHDRRWRVDGPQACPIPHRSSDNLMIWCADQEE